MPIATKSTTPPPQAAASISPHRPAGLAAAAAAYAAAEILVTVFVGRFFALGRAEALLFLALRPWLLLVSAVLAQRLPRRERLCFYVLALALASITESLFLLGLGASSPWAEAARGLAAGVLLVLGFDLVLQLGFKVGGKPGRSLATGLLVILLVIPNGLSPYEAVALGSEPKVDGEKRDLMLMSALPLVWGEKGPLDPGSRPAAAYAALQREFRIRPLDVLDRRSLGTGRLLLLAQPRALTPEELVALDQWVREGGRALILTDPRLAWPSELPLGDIRRPPAIGLLDPLLTHWGLALEAPAEARPVVREVEAPGGDRRLIMFAPGRFVSSGRGCTVGELPEIAQCRLGEGRAALLGDVDMMHDSWWVGPASRGSERHVRISDNPLILADWLDELAGAERIRAVGPVQWLDPAIDRTGAWILALLPILLAAAPAASLRLRRTR